MVSPPEDLYLSAVTEVVQANKHLVPPHGKGSLYLRPLLLGTGPILGLGPAPAYTFVVYGAAVGAYFKASLSYLLTGLLEHRIGISYQTPSRPTCPEQGSQCLMKLALTLQEAVRTTDFVQCVYAIKIELASASCKLRGGSTFAATSGMSLATVVCDWLYWFVIHTNTKWTHVNESMMRLLACKLILPVELSNPCRLVN